MSHRMTAFALVMAPALLAGCSRPNAASEANFARALEPVVADRFCRLVPAELMTTAAGDDDQQLFPLMLTARQRPDQRNAELDAQTRGLLEGAAANGLLTRTITTAPARRQYYTEPLEPTALLVFTPTAAGKTIFRPFTQDDNNHRLRLYPGVCMGRGRVDKVVRWTEPADMFGRTITQVTYTYSAADLPAIMPPEDRARFTRPKEATTTLVRTNDGWSADIH